MAWWEWVPIVSTIGHLAADPPGRKVEDYAACRPTVADCEADPPTAKLQCTQCVEGKLRGYTADWCGTSIGSDVFREAAGQTARAIGAALAKGVGGKFLGLTASAWTGVGAVLAIDAAIDFGVVIRKLMQMWDAANAARDRLCRCGDA